MTNIDCHTRLTKRRLSFQNQERHLAMATIDCLSGALLTSVLSMLWDVTDYQRCEFVCKSWRTASRGARPRKLCLSLYKGNGWPVDNQQAVVKWLQCKLSTHLLEDLQHVYIRGNGDEHGPRQEMAYALPMLFGCTGVSSVHIQHCPTVKLEWLPATVTHLQIEGGLKSSSSAFTTAFPRLQQLIIDKLNMDVGTIDRPFRNLTFLKVQEFGMVFPMHLDRDSFMQLFPILQEIQYDIQVGRRNFAEALVGIASLKKATLTTSVANQQSVRASVEHCTGLKVDIKAT